MSLPTLLCDMMPEQTIRASTGLPLGIGETRSVLSLRTHTFPRSWRALGDRWKPLYSSHS